MPPFVPTLYLAGPDHEAILAAIAPALPDGAPTRVLDGETTGPGGADWAAVVSGASNVAYAEWAGPENDPMSPLASVGRTAGGGLEITLPSASAPRSAADALELLTDGPWETATFPSYGELWRDEFDYSPPSLADGHPPHGWAVALRGAGHDRLVARRWLDQDLWSVHRDQATDTTLVEFHDPALPPLEALSAARAAHLRFGRTDEGGWIPLQPVVPGGIDGLYDSVSRTFKVIVPPGREIEPVELLAVCQARLLRRDSAEPIDRLAYVFLDARAAAPLREELALREIECWVIDGGAERKL